MSKGTRERKGRKMPSNEEWYVSSESSSIVERTRAKDEWNAPRLLALLALPPLARPSMRTDLPAPGSPRTMRFLRR